MLSLLCFRVPFGFLGPSETLWFDQRVDHFDGSTNLTFKQRYYVNSDYAKTAENKSDSLLFYIGGEVPLYGTSLYHLEPTELANKTNSILIGLEHRFFGESVPTEDLSVKNLKYLTIEQALADVADFITKMKYEYCTISNQCSVGVIGGSYPGALSSWFRLLYPHLADFSWASSAPVLIKNDFFEYDEHCADAIKNISSKCYDTTKSTFDYLETIFDTGVDKNETMEMFGIPGPERPDDISFLYMVADVIGSAVQFRDSYSHLTTMCKKFEAASSDADKLSVLATTTKDILKTEKASIWDSYPYLPSNASRYSSTKDIRAWTWMTCNEVGWFQTTSGKLRSKYINKDYFTKVCKTLFDTGLPDEDEMNIRFGGKDPLGTTTVFVNGERDPWMRMSVTKNDENLSRYAYVVKDGQHCDDLRLQLSSDVSDLVSTRKKVLDQLSFWLEHAIDDSLCMHGRRVLNFCICDDSHTGQTCDEGIHSQTSYKIVSIASIVFPTIFLLVIGYIVWAFSQNENNYYETKNAFYN